MQPTMDPSYLENLQSAYFPGCSHPSVTTCQIITDYSMIALQRMLQNNCLPKTCFYKKTQTNLWRNQADLRSFYVDFELKRRQSLRFFAGKKHGEKPSRPREKDRKRCSKGSLVRLILHSWGAPVDLWRTCGDLGISLVIFWWKPIERP